MQVTLTDLILCTGFGEVIRYLDKIAEAVSWPVSTEARNHCAIGMKMLRCGELADAERKLVEAREADPSNFMVRLALGVTYASLDRPADALTSFEKAEKVAEDATELIGVALLFRAWLYANRKDYEQACASLRRATSFCPREARYWYGLARCEAARPAADSCAAALVESIQLDPHNHPRALADPWFNGVRDTVTALCQQLTAEAYQQSATAVDSLTRALDDMEADGLVEYTGGKWQRISSTLEEIRRSLQFKEYVVLREVIIKCATIAREVDMIRQSASGALDAAIRSWEYHRQEEAKTWASNGGFLGLILGGFVGCATAASSRSGLGPWVLGMALGALLGALVGWAAAFVASGSSPGDRKNLGE